MIIAIVAKFEKLKGEFQLSNQLKQAAATPNNSDGKGNNMSKQNYYKKKKNKKNKTNQKWQKKDKQ